MAEIIKFSGKFNQPKQRDEEKIDDFGIENEKPDVPLEDVSNIPDNELEKLSVGERLEQIGWAAKTDNGNIHNIIYEQGVNDGTNGLECDPGNHYDNFRLAGKTMVFDEVTENGDIVNSYELVGSDKGFDCVENGEVGEPFISLEWIEKDPKAALAFWGKNNVDGAPIVSDERVVKVKEYLAENYFRKNYPDLQPEHIIISSLEQSPGSALHNDRLNGWVRTKRGVAYFSLDLDSREIKFFGTGDEALAEVYELDFKKNIPETEERKAWEQKTIEQIKGINPEHNFYFAGYSTDGTFWSVTRENTGEISLEDSLRVYYTADPENNSIEETKINEAEMLRDGGTTTIDTDKGTVLISMRDQQLHINGGPVKRVA